MLLKILNLITMLARRVDTGVIEDVVEAMQSAYEEGVKVGSKAMRPVLDAENIATIVSELIQFRKIAAIKTYRAQTGEGLRDSKVAIEKIAAQLPGYDFHGMKTTGAPDSQVW